MPFDIRTHLAGPYLGKGPESVDDVPQVGQVGAVHVALVQAPYVGVSLGELLNKAGQSSRVEAGQA